MDKYGRTLHLKREDDQSVSVACNTWPIFAKKTSSTKVYK